MLNFSAYNRSSHILEQKYQKNLNYASMQYIIFQIIMKYMLNLKFQIWTNMTLSYIKCLAKDKI